MLRSVKEIQGYAIMATDGDIGSVETLYFDDEQWTVRYIVDDTGGLLPGKQVLLSPFVVRSVDWLDRRVSVALTKQQVESSPGIDTDKPVSRQYEIDLASYYNWPPYWAGPHTWGLWPAPRMWQQPASDTGTRPPQEAAVRQERDQGDRHLRSTKEVIGYHIQAADGELGHVADFIVDDEAWTLRYLVVDTSNWWFGKKVLIDPKWISDVSWPEGKVVVDLRKEQVKDSPEYDPEQPVNRTYEERLYDFYGRPAYWR